MNYEQLINQKVTNYKGEKGYIVSFDQERVVVQLSDKQACYKPDIAFKNKALVFDDDKYNHLINEDIVAQDAAKEAYEKKIQKVTEEAIKINNISAQKYVELRDKDRILKSFFGDDFDYPPFIELKKKFPHARSRDWLEALSAKWERECAMRDGYYY